MSLRAILSTSLVPHYNQRLFVVSLLDHRDSVTEHCHAVTVLQGALALAADVILLAHLEQVIQSCRVKARAVRPETDALESCWTPTDGKICHERLRAGE